MPVVTIVASMGTQRPSAHTWLSAVVQVMDTGPRCICVLHSATCSLRSPPLRRESRGQHQWLTRVVSDGGTSGAATPDAAGAVFVAVRAWAAATSTDTGGRGARASGLGAWCKEAGAVSDNSAGGRCACATCAPCCACATCAPCCACATCAACAV